MPKSLCVELSERSDDSSTGLEERSSVERQIEVGLLQDTVSWTQPQQRKVGGNNPRFILFISFKTW